MAIDQKPSSKTDKWSFLCYIAADNDLSPYGMRDIEEISANGRPDGVYIGVEMDNRGRLGSIRYEITPPDPANNNKGYRTVVDRLPEQDSGSFVTLRNFVDWGLNRSVSPNHFIVVWGHGMGNAIAPDFQSMGSALDVGKLVDAFEQAGFYKHGSKRGPNWSKRKMGRVGVLGFDACNMASIENMWMLRDTAQMVVASQEKVPATGWPYASMVSLCGALAKKNGKADGRISDAVLQTTGRKIIDSYIGSYKEQGYTAVTLSSIIPAKLKGLVSLVNDLGASIASELAKKTTSHSMKTAVKDAILYGQRFHLGDSIDLGDFANLLAKDSGIAGSKTSAMARKIALGVSSNKGIMHGVGKVRGKPNLEVSGATGLSIWLPAQRTLYLTKRNQYAREAGQEFNGWCEFLDTYYR